jgi:hypothetical protein
MTPDRGNAKLPHCKLPVELRSAVERRPAALKLTEPYGIVVIR